MQALISRLEDEFRSLEKHLCLFGKILNGRERKLFEDFLGNVRGSKILVRVFLVGSGPRSQLKKTVFSETIERISKFLEDTRDMLSSEINLL